MQKIHKKFDLIRIIDQLKIHKKMGEKEIEYFERVVELVKNKEDTIIEDLLL